MARQRIETAPEITIYDESFVIKAASGASAPLAEFKNSAGTVVGNIATTGTLNITSVTSGNVVPSTSNTYSLGAVNNVWKDIFVGPGSLYVNGQKVLQDESGVIIVSATVDNNLGLRTSGSGNIELDPTGTGVVSIKGPLVIQAATNITSADGNAVTFGGAINTDTISSKTTNTDLSITANGTGKVYINDNSEVSGNLVVGGNLTVSGTTTTVNSETISLADNLIDLNSNLTTGTPTENAGIRIMRGDTAAVQLRWNEGTDVWEFTNDGSAYNTITPLASPTFTGTVTIPSGASISGFATLANPALTGTPTAPTAANATSTTQIATTSFVQNATTIAVSDAGNNAILKSLVDAKGDLIVGTADDTVSRLAIGTNGYFLKANSSTAAGLEWGSIPTVSILDDVGDVTITSAANGDLLKWNGSGWVNAAGYALLASPALTGTPTAPTAAAATSTTQIATTAFVIDAVTSATAANTVELGVDTTGGYVATLTAGTGITLANNSGEGASPTVTVDTAVIAALASPTFTGTPTIPTGTIATTQSAGNNTTAVATTAFVTTAVAAVSVDFSSDQNILANSIFG